VTQDGTVLWLLALHLVLTGLPGAAATLLAARNGVREVPILLAIGLAASGLVAALAFWTYYAAPEVGETWLFVVLLGSVALSGWSLRGGRIDRALLRELAVPVALWALGSAFVLFFGFLYGDTGEPLPLAATRFSHELPTDNVMPSFFADWFYVHGHAGVPPEFPGQWLASDRPPLQIGYVLSQRALAWDTTGLHYEVLTVVLQQLWIVGLWALLVAARVGRTTKALAMLAVLASGLVIVNGFYTWPKLLPAAFILAAAALVLTPLWPRLRRDPRVALLIGVLLGLAMLGHGASAFGVIPLVAVAALRGFPGWRPLGIAVLAAVVLLVPWFAYQRYADPPGNRLTKWMLGGADAIDSRSTGEAILDGYREAGFGGTVHDKGQNFIAMAGGGPAVERLDRAVRALEAGEPGQAVAAVRSMLFYNLLPSLGLLLAGPVAMLVGLRRRGRRPAEWGLATSCFLFAGIGCLAWGLLLFGDSAARTVIHQGTYAIPILALCGSAVGLRAVFPRFATYLIPVAALATVALYVPWVGAPPGAELSLAAAAAAAAGLLGFLLVSLRSSRVRPAPQPRGVSDTLEA
jgi:hypothetical protein